VQALIYFLQGRQERVPKEVDLAVTDNPKDLPAQTWLELYHEINGDYDPAIQLSKRLLAQAPLYWPAHLDLGEVLRQQGDTRRSIEQQERVLEQDPHNVFGLLYMARAELDSADLRKARETLEHARAEDRRNYRLRTEWAILFALEGKKDQAFQEMDKDVQDYAELNPFSTVRVADFYSLTGQEDVALLWLDKAVRLGDSRADWFGRDPLLAGVRANPKFQSMIASMANRRRRQ